MKKENYAVIGGQYETYYYGSTETLLQAKRLATRNKEYWDNWQGWHTPKIYKIEDTKEIFSRGRLTAHDGQPIRVPINDPAYVKVDGKWIEFTIL